MKFIFDPTWQILFLIALAAWILLLLRELYRFRTLVSRFRALTLVLALLAVLWWVSLFFAMLLRTGVLPAVVTYAFFVVLASIILGFVKSRRSLLFHGESLAQHDWEHAMHKETIEKTISQEDIQGVLCEYGQTTAFPREFMERLVRSGHGGLLRKVGQLPNLRGILEIYARDDWSDTDKIVAATVYLIRVR
jgi:uncharacterized membrane protein (DUF485 family)